MNIDKLVPPVKLCKLIPAGEFADSLGIWVFFAKADKEFHLYLREDYNWSKSENYPAPTTDEILDKCKDILGVLNPTLWYQHEWIADCAYDRTGKLSEEFFEDEDFKNLDIIEGRDKSPVIAAMKLWLKLKGIEYAKVGTKGGQQ